MPKRKYNVKGVEAGGGDFVQAKPGLYQAKIVEATTEKPEGKDERVHVQLEIIGDSKGNKVKDQLKKGQAFSRLHDYVNLESEAAAFKVRQYLEAVGKVDPDKPKTESGTFDADKEWPETIVLVRVKNEPFDGDQRAKPSNIMPLHDEEEPDDDDDEEEEEEEEEDDGDEEDEDEEDEDEDEDEGVDLDELDRKELKAYIKENELDVTVKQKMSEDDIREAIVEAEGEDDDDDEEEEEDEDEGGQDYEEMSVADLRAECKERELATKGKKKELIKRLEKDDEEDPF